MQFMGICKKTGITKLRGGQILNEKEIVLVYLDNRAKVIEMVSS